VPAALPWGFLLLAAAACPEDTPLPDGDAFVRGLVGTQRGREEALSLYTYDVTEVREQLDRDGRVRKRATRVFEVFHVRGRPVRRLVARDGRDLGAKDREREERRVRELAAAIRRDEAAYEQPGMRLSRILERYRFTAVGREEIGGRCALVFDFTALPGKRPIERDGVLRRLGGRLWVDEEERAVIRVDLRNTTGLKFALGLGASVSSLALQLSFVRMEDGVWLPREVEARAEGKRLLVKRFRSRSVSTFGNYRRFSVEVQEEIHP